MSLNGRSLPTRAKDTRGHINAYLEKTSHSNVYLLCLRGKGGEGEERGREGREEVRR